MAAFLGSKPDWPISAITAAVAAPSTISDSSDVFTDLRRAVIRAEKEEIEANAYAAQSIWFFLLEFCAKRRFYRQQVLEIVHALFECRAFEDAFRSDSNLEAKARALPEDVQAALALQHEAIAKSFTAAQMDEFRKKAQPQELPAEVLRSLRQVRAADKLQGEKLKEAEEDAPSVPVVFGGEAVVVSDGRKEAVCEELRDAIENILEIDSIAKLENEGVTAFAQLRRGCLHATEIPEALEQESEHAPEVFNFLIDFTKKHRIRIKQVCEVLNILMDSSPWSAAFEASPVLSQRVASELSEEAQLSFGLQHHQIMEKMPEATKRKAKDEGGDDKGVVGEARKVAQQMDMLRQSLRNLPAPKKDDKAAVGEKRPQAAPPPAPQSKPDEWREATTPEGKKYYYNIRTKVSAWRLPEGAVLAAPRNRGQPRTGESPDRKNTSQDKEGDRGSTGQAERKAGGHHKAESSTGHPEEKTGYNPGVQPAVAPATVVAYNVKDRVEVWSNSKQAWCQGVVEKVSDVKVLVAYQLAGASDWARKELSPDDKSIRKAQRSEAQKSEGSWSKQEVELYTKLWKDNISASPSKEKAIATFLGKSKLPRRALREIWQVSASTSKDGKVGLDQFSMMCRLVGHCQNLPPKEMRSGLLDNGGRPLREVLRLPAFWAKPPVAQPLFPAS